MGAGIKEDARRLAGNPATSAQSACFSRQIFSPLELEWLAWIMGDSREIKCDSGVGKLQIREVGTGKGGLEETGNIPMVEGLEELFPKYSIFVEAGLDMYVMLIRADGRVFISASEKEAYKVKEEINSVRQAVRQLIVEFMLVQIEKLLSGRSFKSAGARTEMGEEQISIQALQGGGYEFQHSVRYDEQSSRFNTVAVYPDGRVGGTHLGLPGVWWLKERFEMLELMQRRPAFKLGGTALLEDGFMEAHIAPRVWGLPDLETLFVARWPEGRSS